MLRVADRMEEEDDLQPLPSVTIPPIRRENPTAATAPAARYGESKAPNWIVIALILIAHALAIAAILHVRHQVQRREEARLSVVNLTPPPPPPAQDAPPPPPSTPQVVAPPPVVRVPAPPVEVATAPQSAPPAPVSRNATVSAPAAVVVNPAAPSMVQAGDLSAQMISGKPPRYPIESRRKHEQGTVVLALTLGLDGAVETVAIAQSSGFSRLDDAARDAVRRWRWRPMIQQGQPVKVKGIVEIPFVLQVSST